MSDARRPLCPRGRGHSIETLRVIDWATPANNEFLLASQMWVAGDMYRRRCDLLNFVNGLPLVREKLVLDWREKQQTKAGVLQTLRIELRRLPAPFTKDVRLEKAARAYAHIYDHHAGAALRPGAP